MAFLMKKAEGHDGRLTLPEIGALIGYFTSWKLWTQNEGKDYKFQANFGFVNKRLWDLKKEDGTPYERLIVVDVGKEKKYRLEFNGEEGSAEIVGQQLNMDHVHLAPYEGR